MMKQIYIAILLLFSVTGFSQRGPEQIIKDVRTYYQENTSLEANILFTIDVPESEKTEMNGKFYLKGDKYRFLLKDQEIISDNVNLWHWSKGSINEVQLSYIENDESIITPSKIFTKFLRGFAYKLVTKTKFKGKDIALVDIIPSSKKEGNDIYKIKVVSDLKTDQLLEMKLFSKDGTIYSFLVKDQKVTTLSDSLFQFDEEAHPEVEVIDLR